MLLKFLKLKKNSITTLQLLKFVIQKKSPHRFLTTLKAFDNEKVLYHFLETLKSFNFEKWLHILMTCKVFQNSYSVERWWIAASEGRLIYHIYD